MDKRNRRRTAVELGKDVLIVLLTCSALWMLGGSGLLQRLELSREESPQVTSTQNAATEQVQAARPMRITATLAGDGEPERCSLQYDDAGVDGVFQQVAGLLMETLSSAEAPQTVNRRAWEQALAQAPGICFDFQGDMPLSVLAGWLNVELELPDTVTRRLLLTVWQDQVALYYSALDDGSWYRCTTPVVSRAQLEHALEGLSANGAYYAFESEHTGQMARDTLLVPEPGPLPVYVASNPVSGGRSALENLMADLGFNLSGCVFYSAAGEEVARSGSDTLRLSTGGMVEYHAGQEGARQFPVTPIAGESGVFAAVESCRQLLQSSMNSRCGQARLYLSRVEQRGSGWHLEFEYSLDGVSVGLKSGPAARFEISAGAITAFTLALRSYAPGEEWQLTLPPVQAAAAMTALELEGRELQLMYRDTGEERVVPNWTAVVSEVR